MSLKTYLAVCAELTGTNAHPSGPGGFHPRQGLAPFGPWHVMSAGLSAVRALYARFWPAWRPPGLSTLGQLKLHPGTKCRILSRNGWQIPMTAALEGAAVMPVTFLQSTLRDVLE